MALYLRLNGYYVSGFIVHAPEGEQNPRGDHRSNRTQVDALAVRFPFNDEPERQQRQSEYLQISKYQTDFLICEVKGGNSKLQFNKGIHENIRSVKSVLRWIGAFQENDLDEIAKHVKEILVPKQQGSSEKFPQYSPDSSCIRIRTILFAPDRTAPSAMQVRYVHGLEIMDFIYGCFRPTEPRSQCQVRYDFGLWGAEEQIVRFFKDWGEDRHPTTHDLYAALLCSEGDNSKCRECCNGEIELLKPATKMRHRLMRKDDR